MENTPTFPLASTSRDGKGAHLWAACLSCHVKAEATAQDAAVPSSRHRTSRMGTEAPAG